MDIKQELQKIISEQITDKRVAATTLQAVELLGTNYTIPEIIEEVGLTEANICRIQTRYRELIAHLRDIYDQHILDNGLEEDPNFKLGKKKSLSRLVAEAKGLDDTFFNLLVDTVKNPNERTSTRITAYEKLQVMLGRMEEGQTSIGKTVEEIEDPQTMPINNHHVDPMGLFQYINK